MDYIFTWIGILTSVRLSSISLSSQKSSGVVTWN